jgi:hypothetical protein
LALVLDSTAYTAFVEPLLQSQENLVNAATRQVLEDFRHQTVLNVATDRERIVSLLPANYNVGAFAGTELIISPDGLAKVRFESGTYPGAWSKGSDAFVITLASSIPYYDSPEQAEATINTLSLRQIAGGPNHGLVSMTMSGMALYGGVWRGPYTKTVVLSAHTWDSLPALSVQDISGKTLAGLPDLISTPDDLFLNLSPKQMRVAFAADGSASLPDNGGASATWSIQDGKLRIVFGDGSVQELARRSANGGRERWIVRHSKGAQFQLYEALMVQVQPGLAWTPALAAQHWRSLATVDQGIQPQFLIKLLADFSGSESSINLDGTFASNNASSWLIDGGRLIATVFRLPDGPVSAPPASPAPCIPAGAGPCCATMATASPCSINIRSDRSK